EAPLRTAMNPRAIRRDAPDQILYASIKKLVHLRHKHSGLRHGEYEQVHVAHEQFAFMRRDGSESIIVALNAGAQSIDLVLRTSDASSGSLVDILNDGESFVVSGGRSKVWIPPRSGRILTIAN